MPVNVAPEPTALLYSAGTARTVAINVDEIVHLEANNVVDTHYSVGRSTAFVVANGDVGDDKIIGFQQIGLVDHRQEDL